MCAHVQRPSTNIFLSLHFHRTEVFEFCVVRSIQFFFLYPFPWLEEAPHYILFWLYFIFTLKSTHLGCKRPRRHVLLELHPPLFHRPACLLCYCCSVIHRQDDLGHIFRRFKKHFFLIFLSEPGRNHFLRTWPLHTPADLLGVSIITGLFGNN